MRAASLILPPLALLRLKLTSDEEEEKEKGARETREKATLVRGEWCLMTLQGNNALFSVMNDYYWWQISKTDIVRDLHTVCNKGKTRSVSLLCKVLPSPLQGWCSFG